MRSCSALLSRSSASALGLGQAGVALERVEVRPQAGQRRAQLVAGVGGEAARRGHRGLQPREHPVERAGERADLVGALVGQRRGEVLRARHARGAGLQARERAHGERAEEPGGEAGEDEREQADQQDQPPDARHALVDRGERGERLEARVRGAAEQDRQRAPRAAVDVDGREALAIGRGGRGVGHVAVLRDDVVAVGDLHEGARPLQQRLARRAGRRGRSGLRPAGRAAPRRPARAAPCRSPCGRRARRRRAAAGPRSPRRARPPAAPRA